MLMGISFAVSAYLQVIRHYSSIKTGLIFTSATVGVLLSSVAAGRLAQRFAQRSLILAGFATTVIGVLVLLLLAKVHPSPWFSVPGLFLIGAGVGLMLTPSVNVVQSAFPEKQQGEISGLSRSVSNLGSSFGTAIAGTIVVAGFAVPTRAYVAAILVMAFIGLIGFAAAWPLPRAKPGTPAAADLAAG
jgi:MFS family permease